MKIITNKEIQAFKEYLLSEEKSTATQEKYIRDITALAIWQNGRELEKQTVLKYKEEIISKYAPASVNSMLSSLNSFFAYMKWDDVKIKVIKIQKQIFTRKEKELTKYEYERLLKIAETENKRLYYLMQTICACGLRVSELKYITCQAVSTGQATINSKGKMRVVLLPKQLCKILKQYIREQKIKKGAVFISRNGNPLDRSNIWSEMKKLCKRAGVERSKVFPHNLRHLFAKTFYSLQKDIVRLADILGHSSIETTRIYTMESGTEHIKLIQKLGLLRC